MMGYKNIIHFLHYYSIKFKLRLTVVAISLLLASFATLLLPYLLRQMIDVGLTMRSWYQLHVMFVQLAIVVFVLAAASSVRFYAISTLTESVISDVKSRLFKKLIHIDYRIHPIINQSTWLSTMQTDTTLIERLLIGSFSQSIRNVIMAIGAMVMMWATAWKLAAAVIVLIAVMVVPLYIFVAKYRLISRQNQLSLEHEHGFIKRVLSGLPFFQVYGQSNRLKNWFEHQLQDTLKVGLARVSMRAWMTFAVMFSVLLILLLITYVGFALTIDQESQLTGGELSQFIIYTALFGGSLSSLSEMGAEWVRALGATDRIISLLHLSEYPKNKKIQQLNRIDTISLHNLTVRVNNKNILEDIEVSIHNGFTSLLGVSGSGKSTLIKTILQMMSPSDGQIVLNGQPISSYSLSDYFKRCAWCADGDVIMPMTVRDNIRLGDWQKSDDEILDAANRAMVMAFVNDMPKGLDAKLIDFGHGLSQGMVQRILIARAFLKQADLTVFDEATNAIDSATESIILDHIKSFASKNRVIFVGHRLNHVEFSDNIIILENGTVKAEGSAEKVRNTETFEQYLAREKRI